MEFEIPPIAPLMTALAIPPPVLSWTWHVSFAGFAVEGTLSVQETVPHVTGFPPFCKDAANAGDW
jgi:hypothetical protein